MAYALQGHVLPRPGRACTHHTTIVPNSVSNGSSNGNGNGSTTHAWQPPYTRSEPQAPAADLMERIREAGVENWEGTGLQYLSDDARVRPLLLLLHLRAWPCRLLKLLAAHTGSGLRFKGRLGCMASGALEGTILLSAVCSPHAATLGRAEGL